MGDSENKRRIEIYDTTLRDGAQGAGVYLSLVDKLNITRRSQAAAYAVRSGIDSSQSGSETGPGTVSK